MSIRYHSTSDADSPDHATIGSWLREHNWQENGPFWQALEDPAQETVPLLVTATSEGEVIGGLIGETQFSWLKIGILGVHPDWRKQGVATSLITTAEATARERGCLHIYVDTMSYQAPFLFPKLGYQTVGVLLNWDSHGNDKHLFRKDLA